ncbi:hypothetical protein DFQ27_007134 [Actinomortierella ambigua]|uniref:Thioredoxin domain-containing protein n=1 Tax=Actinomortierella ambigua TaxID=1343610 RepID=A0A9P6UAU3_9FUNG|nr:hypothetical protein DFQ27_007134 [Actinomortierella ambigua]
MSSSLIVECQTSESLEGIINTNRKVVALFYSYDMPWGKIAEHKMQVVARQLEKGNITTIPFILVNYADFYEDGVKVETAPHTIKYESYVDGRVHQCTGNSAELEGLVTALL